MMSARDTERETSNLGPLDGFEVWDRTVGAPAGQEKKTAFVSVRVGGVVGLNKVARWMLGDPEAVRVMFDPKRGRLALIPTHQDDQRGHRFSYNQGQVSCKSLFDYYGVSITESRRYHDFEIIDGVLVVDL